MTRTLALALLLTGSALAVTLVPAMAQDQSTEAKLRDALRQTTVDLRNLQDSQAQLQADRDSALKQRDALQQQLNDADAKLAALQAQQPKGGGKGAPSAEDLKRLQAALADAQQQNGALAANNAKFRDAYRQAAEIAQQKDAEARRNAQALAAAQKEDALDYETNQKLAALAKDILHLYQSQNFRSILLYSYEPVLGLYKVKVDNTVQDYDDKIYDLRLFQKKAVQP